LQDSLAVVRLVNGAEVVVVRSGQCLDDRRCLHVWHMADVHVTVTILNFEGGRIQFSLLNHQPVHPFTLRCFLGRFGVTECKPYFLFVDQSVGLPCIVLQDGGEECLHICEHG